MRISQIRETYAEQYRIDLHRAQVISTRLSPDSLK